MPRNASALVPATPITPRAGYALEIAKWPSVWGAVVLGVSTGLAINAVLLIPFAVVALGATWVVAGNPRVQRQLEREVQERELRRRRDDRETRLEDAHVARGGLTAATALVDTIVRADPSGAIRDELETLLDHYADVAIAHARCTAITQAAERSEPAPGASAPQLAVRERQRDIHTRNRDRARALDDELAALLDLLQYLAEREVALGPDVDDVVGERLAQLDADD